MHKALSWKTDPTAQAGKENRFFFLLVLTVFCCVFSGASHAHDSPPKTIFVGLGISHPPYIVPEENTGLEYDIINEAFARAGYRMEARYLPLIRVPYELAAGKLDAGMNLRPGMVADVFFSQSIITYKNYAITLSRKNINISSVQDLGGYSMVAFQNAQKLLGQSFRAEALRAPFYNEVANQESQVRLLQAGRVEVVIADFRIFDFFKNKVEQDLHQKINVTHHDVFDPSPYAMAFREKPMRDAFDQGFEELKSSGRLDEIYQAYGFEAGPR